jgi:S-adenosylmethionine:tRNA ribosyltransferase-isomerase
MKRTDFDYTLPPELIAHHPSHKRSHSRLLMVQCNTGELAHHAFYQLIDRLKPNDLLVINDSKVIKARLFGRKKSGGQIEILIERLINQHEALCHIKASKSPPVGSQCIIEDLYPLHIVARHDNYYHIRCEQALMPILERHGHMPLPPYIKRADTPLDQTRYQTVYAKHPGSVAAPTAGLHFDEDLLEQINNKGIGIAKVTLHVGAGTFQPVRAEDIRDHDMHKEWIEVPQSTCDAIAQCHASGGRVIAVGTTSVRCLETAAQSGTLRPYLGDTNIFIYPGYTFQCVDAIITNFHLPQSTLLMLVSAFCGQALCQKAYATAIAQGYRFYSYGDAMFLET